MPPAKEHQLRQRAPERSAHLSQGVVRERDAGRQIQVHDRGQVAEGDAEVRVRKLLAVPQAQRPAIWHPANVMLMRWYAAETTPRHEVTLSLPHQTCPKARELYEERVYTLYVRRPLQ